MTTKKKVKPELWCDSENTTRLYKRIFKEVVQLAAQNRIGYLTHSMRNS